MIVHFSDLQLGSSSDYWFNEGWIQILEGISNLFFSCEPQQMVSVYAD